MSAFDEMVRPSLARIGAPGDGYATDRDDYWGSGFFIAPGWLLTCAHVVGKGGAAVWRGENVVGVSWEGRTAVGTWRERTATGAVVLAEPRPEHPDTAGDRWRLPDIALVRVPDAEDARCLWLSDRAPSTPAPIGLHGWSRRTGELGVRHGVGEAAGSDGRALLINGTLPFEGLSGGPVIDRRYGAVIGMIKGRGRDEGAAVPITALRELLDVRGGVLVHEVLRAHDLHHLALLDDPAEYAHWTAAQTGLPGYEGSGITPELRARLYGHLAHLPPPAGPGEVVHLVEEVRARVLNSRHRSLIVHEPRSWREGAGLLHGLRAPGHAAGGTLVDLDAVLLYAARVTRHTVQERPDEVAPERLRAFADWITEQADRHEYWAVGEAIHGILDGLLDPAAAHHAEPAAGRTDVLVKVGEPMYGDRYPWSVQLVYDGEDVTPVAGDDRGVRADELSATLRGPLARALSQGDHGEHLAAVEVFLPRRLFDLPVDDWGLAPAGAAGEADEDPDDPDERAMPLGLRRTVVIRDARRNARRPSPEWLKRWRGTARGPLSHQPLRGEAPADGHTPGGRTEGEYAVYGRLSALDNGCVPVYCGPVGSGEGQVAMKYALMAGHSVVLWRRDRHDHEECRAFHRQAAGLLGLAERADELHGPVRDLRIRLADPDTVHAQGLRGKLAVLFDPPDRTPYGTEAMRPPPLAAPGG
ncbi:trypsin-like peptidase domain-containing protein [Streptomyces shenzhenensis]|uniref:VMAP-C domain-containing protein n=1 Tax=Streptomyces shenzhenensis TaxID=943815 RepID=UPI0037F120A6